MRWSKFDAISAALGQVPIRDSSCKATFGANGVIHEDNVIHLATQSRREPLKAKHEISRLDCIIRSAGVLGQDDIVEQEGRANSAAQLDDDIWVRTGDIAASSGSALRSSSRCDGLIIRS